MSSRLNGYVPFTIGNYSASIVAVDGTEYIMSNGSMIKFEIFESIYDTSVHGLLTLMDNEHIRERIPLIGQEKVLLNIKKEDIDIPFSMNITSIEGGLSSDGLSVLMLYLTTDLELANGAKIISRSFQDLSSNVIKKLIGETDKNTLVDIINPGINRINYIAPAKRPLSIIEDIVSNSYDKDGYPLLAYQRSDNTFVVSSIKGLMDQKPKYTYNDSLADVGSDPMSAAAQFREDDNVNKIKRYNIEKAYDIQSLMQQGVYGSNTVSYDISLKRYGRTQYRYAEDSNRSQYLSDQFMIGDIQVSRNSTARQYTHGTNELAWSSTAVPNLRSFPSDLLAKRVKEWDEVEVVSLNAIINPRHDLKLGDMITLKLRSSISQYNNSNTKDMMLSGDYLISAVKHSITAGKWEMSVNLIKGGHI